MTIELEGLELHGYHGVLEHERREGQRFLVDLRVELADERAGATDRLDDSVDYRELVALVRGVSEERAYQLLEAFAGAVADTLLERFPFTAVRVRVRKPDVVLELPVRHAAVIVERHRASPP